MTVVLKFDNIKTAKSLVNALSVAVNTLAMGNVQQQEASAELSYLYTNLQEFVNSAEDFVENELKVQGKVKRNAKRN